MGYRDVDGKLFMILFKPVIVKQGFAARVTGSFFFDALIFVP